MKNEVKSCKLGEKTICPRCQHEFVPDKELVEQNQETGIDGAEDLNALVACPICGNKLKLKL